MQIKLVIDAILGKEKAFVMYCYCLNIEIKSKKTSSSWTNLSMEMCSGFQF